MKLSLPSALMQWTMMKDLPRIQTPVSLVDYSELTFPGLTNASVRQMGWESGPQELPQGSGKHNYQCATNTLNNQLKLR